MGEQLKKIDEHGEGDGPDLIRTKANGQIRPSDQRR
jgi:hypothetical protein